MKKDYDKANQAAKLLEESKVNYVLGYENCEDDNQLCAYGNYGEIRHCLISAMTQIAKVLKANYGDEKVVCELQGMVLQAVGQLYSEEGESKEIQYHED